MTNNLWKMEKYQDFIDMMRSNSDRFIVFVITSGDTDNKTKCMLCDVLREKAQLYPKVLFLYYKAKREDVGRSPPIFTVDDTQDIVFPKIMHMYNNQILVAQSNIYYEDYDLISDFRDFHQVYLNGKPFQNTTDDEPEPEPEPELEPEQEPEPEQQYSDTHDVTKALKIPDAVTIAIRTDPEIEKKKYLEKIEMLQQKQDECLLEFLEDCKQRKKEEEDLQNGITTQHTSRPKKPTKKR